MPTPRASIIAGPGRATFAGQNLFFQNDLTVSPKITTFDVKTSGRRTQKRQDDVMYEITGIPNGVFTPVATLINEYAAMVVGADIFTSADRALVIHSADGQVYTYKAAALTKLSDLMLSAGKTLWGSLTFTGIGANNTAATAADRLATIAAGAYPDPDGYNPDDIITQPYVLSWGPDAPWLNLETEAGVTVTFNLSISPKKIDSAGTIGMRFGDLTVTAKAKPVGVSSADVLAALKIQGAGAGRGRSMAASGKRLTVSGEGVFFALNAASLTDGGDVFSGEKNRVDDLTWVGSETFVGGQHQPLFELAATDPED